MSHHDWPQIIAEIAAAYLETEGRPLSSYKLGVMIGRDHRAIELIAAGSEPKHRDGEALLSILAARTGKNTIVQSDN